MTRFTTIQCSAGSVRLENPRDGIGFFEAIALTTRGWFDRATTRQVADAAHTYSLHRLERRHRRIESRIVSKVEPLVSKLSVKAARLSVTTGMQAGQAAGIPNRSELDKLSGKDRHDWAKRVRSSHASNRSTSERSGRIHTAKEDAAEIAAELTNVEAETDAVRLQWREAYMLRSARYTRARFGRRLTMSATPNLADYRFADGPDITRTAVRQVPGARRTPGMVTGTHEEDSDE